MQAAPLAPHLRAYAPDFARRFALITAGLIAVIARGFLKNPRLVILTIPLHKRLTRASKRCNAFLARLAAGKLPRRAAKRDGSENDRDTTRPPREPRQPATGEHAPIPRIPNGSAWLYQALRHEAAAYSSQLAHLLAEPATVELLAAAPAIECFLRPICRLLGLKRETQRGVVSPAPAAPSDSSAPRAEPPKSAHPPPAPKATTPPPLSPFDYLPWIIIPPKKPA